MALTGPAILAAYSRGDIEIHPFKEEQLGVNSYDVTLYPEIVVYKHGPNPLNGGWGQFNPAGQPIEEAPLDPKIDNPTKTYEIGEHGFVIVPGELYLCRTNEIAGSMTYLPEFDGRSSVGRLGIGTHVTAGRGDVGFVGTWTLEVWCIRPVVLYPDMPIGQVYFNKTEGDVQHYHGKYTNQIEITPSRLFRHWQGESHHSQSKE